MTDAANILEFESTASQRAVSLRARVAGGAAWTFVGFFLAQVLRLGSNLILTRLLIKDLFGLMTLVNTFIAGLHMFSDVGIGPAIVQRKRGDDSAFLNTAWTIQVIRGLGVWTAACALAWPIAHFYGHQSLMWIMPVVGITAILDGFASTSLFTLNRKLSFKGITIVELGSQIAGIAVMVTWALIAPSIWALLAGGIVTALARSIGSHFIQTTHRDRFMWDRDCARDLMTFGRWIFISTAVTFLAMQVDRLLLPKFIDIGEFGVYGIALNLALIPTMLALKLAQSVVFPMFSKIVNESGELNAVYNRMRRPLLCGAGACAALLASCGPGIVAVLYPPAYANAGVYISILSLLMWFTTLESINGSVLLAHGRANWLAVANVSKLVALLAFLPIGFYLGGTPGAIAAVAIAEGAKYLASAVAIRIHGLRVLVGDLLSAAFFAIPTGIVWLLPTPARLSVRTAGLVQCCLGLLVVAIFARAFFMLQRKSEVSQ